MVLPKETSDGRVPMSSSSLDQSTSTVSDVVVERRCRVDCGPLGRRVVGGFGRVSSECVKGSQTCIGDAVTLTSGGGGVWC